MAGVLQSPIGAKLMIDGRIFSNFAGSSYLGLNGIPEILCAGVDALAQYGAGTSLLRDQGFVTPPLLDAEAAAAERFGRPDTLFLPNGYLFGFTILHGLRPRYDTILYDERAHVSLLAAIRASGVSALPFRHLDAEDLRRQLKQVTGRPLVVTDGLYSLFGEIPPLADYAEAILPKGGHLVVDESHGFGILGPTGCGACEHHGLPPAIWSSGGSLAKAFGVAAGVIVADQLTIERCRQAPSNVGASLGLSASAAMAAASLRYVSSHPQLLTRLRTSALHAKKRLREIGLDIAQNCVPIIAFSAGDQARMQRLRTRLQDEGLLVYLTSYGDNTGQSIIRIGIFADHEIKQIDALADALARQL